MPEWEVEPPDSSAVETAEPLRRVRVIVSYDGTNFHGWQVQPGVITIQSVLQDALAIIEGAPVIVAGSGRTDAGVHALGQVAAFSLRNPIPVENLQRAANRLLPGSIRILAAAEAHREFHPRFDAVSKTYEYRIFRGEICPAFESNFVYHHPYPLNVERMLQLAPLLEGEHDFSAFAAADDRDVQGRSKIRRIFSSNITIQGEYLIYRVRGSGFLKHMVRNIVGTLLEVGKGNVDEELLGRQLGTGLRISPSQRAPAKGLYLLSVDY